MPATRARDLRHARRLEPPRQLGDQADRSQGDGDDAHLRRRRPAGRALAGIALVAAGGHEYGDDERRRSEPTTICRASSRSRLCATRHVTGPCWK